MKIKFTALFLFCNIYSVVLLGQDVHFSQFFASPLMLNPALTGYSTCRARVGAQSRTQRNNDNTRYDTKLLYGDARLTPAFLNRSWVGVGAQFYRDVSGDGNLTSHAYSLPVALHLHLYRAFYLSTGYQLEFVSKYVDYSRLTFNNQWNGWTFDSKSPNGEPVSNQPLIRYLNHNVGVILTNDQIVYRWFVGYSLNHSTQPLESFYGSPNQLGKKNIFHAGLSGRMSGSWDYETDLMYTSQKGATEVILGANFLYDTYSGNTLYFGVWNRYRRDIIVLFGYRFRIVPRHHLKLLLSQDVSLNRLSDKTFVGKIFTSPELSATYTYNQKPRFGSGNISDFNWFETLKEKLKDWGLSGDKKAIECSEDHNPLKGKRKKK